MLAKISELPLLTLLKKTYRVRSRMSPEMIRITPVGAIRIIERLNMGEFGSRQQKWLGGYFPIFSSISISSYVPR